jgi:hypothetical protein
MQLYDFNTAVKRFTKDELLAPRKPPKDLTANINLHPDVISLVPFEPVCTLGIDIEEVLC